MELPPDFIHEPPKGYRYRITQFRANVIGIWCDHLNHYCFSNGDKVSTIWGFYNTKKREYYAPINAKKIGAVVDINSTRPLTAMQINRRGLESLWL